MTALTNDKKRRDYVNNPANWEQVSEMNGLVVLKRLEYKKLEWFAVDIWQTTTHWDYKKKEVSETAGWRRLGMFKLDKDRRVLSYGMSATEIADEIKTYDKEERHD